MCKSWQRSSIRRRATCNWRKRRLSCWDVKSRKPSSRSIRHRPINFKWPIENLRPKWLSFLRSSSRPLRVKRRSCFNAKRSYRTRKQCKRNLRRCSRRLTHKLLTRINNWIRKRWSSRLWRQNLIRLSASLESKMRSSKLQTIDYKPHLRPSSRKETNWGPAWTLNFKSPSVSRQACANLSCTRPIIKSQTILSPSKLSVTQQETQLVTNNSNNCSNHPLPKVLSLQVPL